MKHIRTGIIVIAVGIIFLLKNLGYLDQASFSIVWPTLLVVAGLALIVIPPYRCGMCRRRNWKGHAVCRDCVGDMRTPDTKQGQGNTNA